jgi:hypothetical protein
MSQNHTNDSNDDSLNLAAHRERLELQAEREKYDAEERAHRWVIYLDGQKVAASRSLERIVEVLDRYPGGEICKRLCTLPKSVGQREVA